MGLLMNRPVRVPMTDNMTVTRAMRMTENKAKVVMARVTCRRLRCRNKDALEREHHRGDQHRHDSHLLQCCNNGRVADKALVLKRVSHPTGTMAAYPVASGSRPTQRSHILDGRT